jgi:hypothetical protein
MEASASMVNGNPAAKASHADRELWRKRPRGRAGRVHGAEPGVGHAAVLFGHQSEGRGRAAQRVKRTCDLS